jgi:hypothetical protein
MEPRPPARPRNSTRAPAYPRLAIALAAVVLGGCPIYPENGAADEPHPAGAPVGPWGEAGPGGPVFDAPVEPPDSGAADGGPDGATEDAVAETGADAEGDASSGQAVDGDGGPPPVESDSASDTAGGG